MEAIKKVVERRNHVVRNKSVSYGINKEYLKDWTVKEAYREILQNFMDYGTFKVEEIDGYIVITNDFVPENLDFLSIGYSRKDSGSIGKHGEGLKMAMMILARENLFVSVRAGNKYILPTFKKGPIGEVFGISIRTMEDSNFFCLTFKPKEDTWNKYFGDSISEDDIIYENEYYGSIVNRDPGNIYSGGLFVTKAKNMSKAYDINPAQLSLDRDRKTPASFDLNWACSKINQEYGRLTLEELNLDDLKYVDKIPVEVKKQIKPRLVGNSIEATYRHKGKDVVITNENVKAIVLKDNFFKHTIVRLKRYLLKGLGVIEMMEEFKNKHIHSEEARRDFDLIIERIK